MRSKGIEHLLEATAFGGGVSESDRFAPKLRQQNVGVKWRACACDSRRGARADPGLHSLV